jgi:hypothetical protein
MKQADGFSHNRRCRDGSDERHRYGLAGEVVAPAFIAADIGCAGRACSRSRIAPAEEGQSNQAARNRVRFRMDLGLYYSDFRDVLS